MPTFLSNIAGRQAYIYKALHLLLKYSYIVCKHKAIYLIFLLILYFHNNPEFPVQIHLC